MKLSLKAGIAVGTLALGSGAAFADTVTLGAGPIPEPGAPNGGAVLAVWNASKSLTQYLNIGINQLLSPTLTQSGGYVLDFGTVDLSTFGSPTGLQYAVVAGDYNGAAPNDWNAAFTGGLNQPSGTDYGVTGDSLANVLNTMTALLHQQNVACGATAPCIATNTQSWFAGNFLPNLSDLPFAAAGAVGTALSFWKMTGTSEFGFDAASTTKYSNASGLGQWLLSNIAGTNNYNLTYSIAGAVSTVPLPAAVWLLLSGLTGFGVVGRRRKVAMA